MLEEQHLFHRAGDGLRGEIPGNRQVVELVHQRPEKHGHPNAQNVAQPQLFAGKLLLRRQE